MKKKSFAQRKLVILWCLLGALALLIAGYFITDAIIDGLSTDDPGKDDPDFDLIEGESYYLGIPLVYDPVSATNIQAIVVKQGSEEFTLARMESFGNNFIFSFKNKNGEQIYLPDAAYKDSYFDYTDLYAGEALVSGSSDVPKISYVCSAVGMLYYDQRIKLSDDTTERNSQLAEYGFDIDSPVITFAYTRVDKDGKEHIEQHKIRIGGKVITDAAYYFMIDDREYVYATTTPYFDYALLSLEDFIKSTLVAGGVASDANYGPRLTPDYKQWKNTTYYYEVDSHGNYTYYYSGSKSGQIDPWLIPEGAKIYAKVSTVEPIDYTAGYYVDDDFVLGSVTPDSEDGYRNGATKEEIFDLAAFNDINGYAYALKNLVGQKIGAHNGTLSFTGIGSYIPVKFGEGESKKSSVTYGYNILAVESFFNSEGEITEPGAAVADADKVKVTYYYTIDDEQPVYDIPCHTIIDLSRADLLGSEVVSKLRAASIGNLTENIVFDITYDEQNSIKRTNEIIITDIFRVYSADGKQLLSTVASDSIVSFRYYQRVDGVAMGEEEALTVALSAIGEESGPLYNAFKEVLIGKKLDLDQSIVAYTEHEYCQPMSYFTAYSVRDIEFFVTSELVVSFKFINSSNRDPFTRESVYENTMGAANKFGLYAVNSTTCQSVVNILGGATSDSSGAEGYIGLETVSVDLSPENMKKYGLFANTIYFELPRGLYSPDYSEELGELEYAWYETLGFTLYISNETFDEDGNLCRYAASTLYNIIAKVDPEDFRFLEYSFVELWARRDMFVVDIQDIDEIKVDLNLEDLYGSYTLDLVHNFKYTSGTNVWYDKAQIPSGTDYNTHDEMALYMSAAQNMSASVFKTLYEEKGIETINFNDVYKRVTGADKAGTDTYAASNLKEFVRMLIATTYNGSLTEQEQAEAKQNCECLMSLEFKLTDVAYRYGYDFYRIDDRRVMVSIYQLDSTGDKMNETSYFYISSPTFKKIATAWEALLNGETLNNDQAYYD